MQCIPEHEKETNIIIIPILGQNLISPITQPPSMPHPEDHCGDGAESTLLILTLAYISSLITSFDFGEISDKKIDAYMRRIHPNEHTIFRRVRTIHASKRLNLPLPFCSDPPAQSGWLCCGVTNCILYQNRQWHRNSKFRLAYWSSYLACNRRSGAVDYRCREDKRFVKQISVGKVEREGSFKRELHVCVCLFGVVFFYICGCVFLPMRFCIELASLRGQWFVRGG